MEIVFKPNQRIIIAGYISISVIILPFLLFFFVSNFGIIHFLALMLIPFIFFFLLELCFSKKCIFNTNSNSLTIKRLFSSKTYSFNEVYKIEEMVSASNAITYSIIFKNDKYGHGIKLNIPTYEQSKNGKILSQKVSEVKNKLNNTSSELKNTMKVIRYKYYINNGKEITLKKNYLPLKIVVLILIVFSIYSYIKNIEIDEGIPVYILILIPILIFSNIIGQKIVFNIQNKKIVKSFFGLFKTSFDYNKFQRFIITKHTTNFTANGVSVSLELKKGNKTKELKLEHFKNSKEVEPFLNETKIVLMIEKTFANNI